MIIRFQHARISDFVLFVFASFRFLTVDAFAPTPTLQKISDATRPHSDFLSFRHTTHPLLVLHGMFSNDDDFNDDEEDEEGAEETTLESVEHARQRFEDLMSIPQDNKSNKSSNSNSHSLSSSSPSINELIAETSKSTPNLATLTRTIATLQSDLPPPPLTAIQRERRLKELNLLSSLSDSDEGINELWSLWFSERGPTAATILLRAEELVSQSSKQPQKLEEAESVLWGLIESYGLHWAEPVNRLATVLYLQGRLEESRALCKAVLDVKPWHFGALSGIVLVCAGLRDVSEARLWADRRLPPLIPDRTSGGRREIWVNQACQDARSALSSAEKVGRDSDIGVEEVEFRRMRNQLEKGVRLRHENDEDSDAGSWQ